VIRLRHWAENQLRFLVGATLVLNAASMTPDRWWGLDPFDAL
jgi:hypothetical protein